MQSKRGLSGVITTLIIILLVIAAIGIIWAVVNPFIRESAEEISLAKFTLDLGITQAYFDGDNILIGVKRGAGEGDLVGLKFVISDGQNSIVVERASTLAQQEMETYTLTGIVWGDVVKDDVTEISVAPIYATTSGTAVTGEIVDTYVFGSGITGGLSGEGTPEGTVDEVCGDGVVEGIEQCDGGTNCIAAGEEFECVCEELYGPTDPISINCQVLPSCPDGTCDVNDGETPETCSDCGILFCNPDCSGTCGVREPVCGALCECGAGEMCVDGGCITNLILSGTISSVWPGSAPKYFDSEDLPKDGTESEFIFQYINFEEVSEEDGCITIMGVNHVIEGEYDMTHLELERVASIANGEGYSIWRSSTCEVF